MTLFSTFYALGRYLITIEEAFIRRSDYGAQVQWMFPSFQILQADGVVRKLAGLLITFKNDEELLVLFDIKGGGSHGFKVGALDDMFGNNFKMSILSVY